MISFCRENKQKRTNLLQKRNFGGEATPEVRLKLRGLRLGYPRSDSKTRRNMKKFRPAALVAGISALALTLSGCAAPEELAPAPTAS